ncbi:hypothetical protein MKX01_032518 [Papaver californicum]|nr:hypothetical protein MKX01_032518 [Papaver californicum]
MNRTTILKGPVVFSPKIAPKTLQLALSNENQLLGSSPNGKYYRTVLDNGLIVAVKQLEPFEIGSQETQSKSVKKRVQQELEILASVGHRNLMSLRAYIREKNRSSLVYDYVVTGSLEDVMNRVRLNELQLNWEVRRRIAVGVIKGLDYLHSSCMPRILHCNFYYAIFKLLVVNVNVKIDINSNLKLSNVMLDAEFEPRLADSGLAHLMPDLSRLDSFGYTAPVCFKNSRDPSDPFFGEVSGGGSLRRWLRHLQQAGETREALDKSLLGEEVEEVEMLMAVRIVVVSLSNCPADRPSSDELVPMLTELHSF